MTCACCSKPINPIDHFWWGAGLNFCDEGCYDIEMNCPDNICCCGDPMGNHSWDGHSPLSMKAYALSNKPACEHVFVTMKTGGSPVEYGSEESVVVCFYCGEEKV
jgi:hypothetical protein